MKGRIKTLTLLLEGVRRRSLLALFLLLFLGVTEGASLLLIIPLLAIAGVAGTADAEGGIALKVSQLFESFGLELNIINVLLIYVLVLSFYALLKFFQSMNTVKVNQQVVTQWRNTFFRAVSLADWKTFKDHKSTDLQNILTLEIRKFGAITNQLVNLLGTLILIGVYLLISAFLSVHLTLIALIPILLIALLNKSVNRNTYEIGKKTVNFNQQLQLSVLEFLSAMKLVKVYQKGDEHSKSFSKINHEVEEKTVKFQFETQKTRTLFEILAAFLIAIYIYFALEVFRSGVSEILLLIFIFARLVPKAVKLVGNYQQLLNLLPAVERTQEVLKKLKIRNSNDAAIVAKAPSLVEKIEFKKVDFAYDSQKVLEHLSLEVLANQITLLKGESGSGKSTIIDLILGLHQADVGEVLIDGTSIAQLNQEEWKSIISYVPQEPYLFHDTIKHNIIWGNPKATEQDIFETLNLLSMTEIIKKLPNGLSTLVGDRGTKLSGGERQRIILARALIRKPKLLILDEATNELDEENTALIANSLRKLKGETTILIATHQDQFDKFADQILKV
ncbi:MAG: ABC transporter ATP-binding protein [Vicingaceae bacterium]